MSICSTSKTKKKKKCYINIASPINAFRILKSYDESTKYIENDNRFALIVTIRRKKVDYVYLICLCELYLFEIDKYNMKFVGY